MVKLTDEIKESLAATKLAFFATSAKDHTPNVVPVAAFKVLDDTSLLISDQFFNKTLANMKENKKQPSPGGGRRPASRSRVRSRFTPMVRSGNRMLHG
jgi:predicted pyridoxine 5'-phosphate oxidase superfamily flavin-nucleotide-binding protein